MNIILVGLGSGGSRITNNFAKSVKKERKEDARNDIIKTVCIDTDETVIDECMGYVDHAIHVRRDDMLQGKFEAAKPIRASFDNNGAKYDKTYYKLSNGSIYYSNKLELTGDSGGSGKMRTVSNVLLLESYSNFDETYNAFNDIYSDIKGRVISANVKYMIWVVVGAGGGAGSGLAPGVTRIIKSIFGDHCDIHLLLLLPNGSDKGRNFLDIANSYALVKELDYLWHIPDVVKTQIYDRDIINGGSELFKTVNFLAMHHFKDHKAGIKLIQESIVPNFIKIFQYGRYTPANVEVNIDNNNKFQPLIEMRDFDTYLLTCGGRYGSINFFEVGANTEKLMEYCILRDDVESLYKVKSDLEKSKIQINSLLYGSEKFNHTKREMIKDKSNKTKDIWRMLIKDFDWKDIGLTNLQEAKGALSGLLGIMGNEDTTLVDSHYKNARNRLIGQYEEIAACIKDIQDDVIVSKHYKIGEFKKYKDIKDSERYIRSLNTVIDDILKIYGEKKEYVALNLKKKDIIDSSKGGTVHSIPEFRNAKVPEGEKDTYNDSLFDTLYRIYKENGSNLDFSLSTFISKLNDSPENLAKEKIQGFFRNEKEYSLFYCDVEKQAHPLSWSVCLSHDDHILSKPWRDLAIKGYNMGPDRTVLHTLDASIKHIWPKDKWCMISWINGYELRDSKDFKNLEDSFGKLNQTRYNQIMYPESFGAMMTGTDEILREESEKKTREKAEREAKEKAEKKTREKAEREVKEKAEREAREKADQEAREKADQEARDKTEREEREESEREAREKAGQEAKDKAERETKKKADQEAKDKAERETKKKADQEAKDKAERETKENGNNKKDMPLEEKIVETNNLFDDMV